MEGSEVYSTDRVERWSRLISVGAIVVFVGVKAFYGLKSLTGSGVIGPRVIAGYDTDWYAAAASKSMFSSDFWTAVVPAGYPLLIKLAFENWRAVVGLQTAISIACWIYLARNLSGLFVSHVAQCVAVVAVMLTGISASFQIWDVALGTESLSLALLCGLFGATCKALSTRGRSRDVWVMVAWAAAASITRDSNAALLAPLAILALMWLGLRRSRPRRVVYFASVGVVLFAAVGSLALSSSGRRWYWQMVDTVALRVVDNPRAEPYFAERGLPLSPAVLALHNDYFANGPDLYSRHPRFEAYQDWIAAHGRDTYYSFLASHPAWIVTRPVELRSHITSPGFGGQGRQFVYDIPIDDRTRKLGAIAFPEVDALRYAILGATLVGAAILLLRKKTRSPGVRWAAGVGLVAVPHALIVYHGDALELARHAIGVTLQLQIVTIAVLAAVVDAVVSRRTAPASV